MVREYEGVHGVTVSEREKVRIRQCMRIPEVQIMLERKVMKRRVKLAAITIQRYFRGFVQRKKY